MKTRISAGTLFFILPFFMVTNKSLADDPISSIVPPGVLYEVLTLNRDLATPKKPKYNSPCAMVPSPDDKLLYIAQQTAKRIDVCSIEAKTVVRKIHLPDEVTGIAIAPDRMELYATCTSERWPAGKTCVVNIESGRVAAVIATGWGSCAPVVNPDESELYVCNRFSNDVSVVDLNSRKEKKRITVSREPCCAAITSDGATLVVGNNLPDDLSTDTSDISCKVSLIDTKNGTLRRNIRLTLGSKAVQDVCISADGKYAFLTHLTGSFNIVNSTPSMGWIMHNSLSVIDIENDMLVNTTTLDLATVGMGNPWGVRCSKDGTMLVVAHAGCNQLSIIKCQPFIDTVLAYTEQDIDLRHNFRTMATSRERIETALKGLRSIAIVGSNVFAAGYFSDSLMQVELSGFPQNLKWEIEYIPFGDGQTQTAERKGERMFYEALSFQHWLSCSSCHQNGRPDGYNWILGGGARQNPKNTRSMLHAWWTPPLTWSGRRENGESAIKAAIELKLFMMPEDSIAQPLDTFCMNLNPVQSPYRIKGKLSESAQRGKNIFGENCTACHPSPLFADSDMHATPVMDPFDDAGEYIAPGLIEAWRTGPYGHIGSIGTVREMIEEYMAASAERQLTQNEIDDLAEYVLSL